MGFRQSKIHTDTYYREVELILMDTVDISGANREDVIEALRQIAKQLEDSTFPV